MNLLHSLLKGGLAISEAHNPLECTPSCLAWRTQSCQRSPAELLQGLAFTGHPPSGLCSAGPKRGWQRRPGHLAPTPLGLPVVLPAGRLGSMGSSCLLHGQRQSRQPKTQCGLCPLRGLAGVVILGLLTREGSHCFSWLSSLVSITSKSKNSSVLIPGPRGKKKKKKDREG